MCIRPNRWSWFRRIHPKNLESFGTKAAEAINFIESFKYRVAETKKETTLSGYLLVPLELSRPGTSCSCSFA